MNLHCRKRLKLLPLLLGGLLVLSTTAYALPEAGVFPALNDTNGKAKADQYEAWLGKDINYILQFYAGTNWDMIDGTNVNAGLNWWCGQWADYPQEYRDRLVIAIPILPSYDGNGDHQPDDGSTLAKGALGQYNHRWVNAANKLVARGFANATLRLGWEFNGGWYTWNAKNGRATAFRDYWIQIVNSMRSVPGQNFKFCWNPTAGDQGMGNPMTAFPGAAYVDYIGIDIYDTSSSAYYGTPGYPDSLPTWQVNSIRSNAWLAKKQWGNYHLDWWSGQAASVGVPLCFPEWGLDAPIGTSNGYGGKDNPYFLTKFHEWITNPAHNVAWHAYFEAGAGGASRNHQIYFSNQFPNAKALFPTLFGLRFTDSFGGGLGQWTPGQPTQWTVVSDGGDSAYQFDFNWSSQSGTSLAGNQNWTNYRVSTEFKITDLWSWCETHLYARHVDSSNYYRAMVQDQGGPRKVVLQKRVAGVTSSLGSASVTVNPNTWYDLALEVDGSSLTVFLNGVEVLQRTDTAHTAGKIGLGVWKSDVRFDNVTVY